MKYLILRTLYDKRYLILFISLGSLGLLLLYSSLFPSIRSQAASLDSLFKSYPPSILKAFGVSSTLGLYNHLGSYLSTEFYSVTWVIFAVTLSIIYTTSTISSEIEKRNLGLVISSSLQRWKIYLCKYISGILILLTFNVFSILPLYPISKLGHYKILTENIFYFFLVGLLICISIYSLGLFFSAIFSETSKSAISTAIVCFGMFILNIVVSINSNLDGLKYVSIFHYYDPSLILTNAGYSPNSYLFIFIFLLLFSLLGGWMFSIRDISI